MAGEPQVIPEGGRPWTQRLRREKEAGILNHRVHVLRRPLTDYLRFECEGGYVQNGQFEDIRILDATDRSPPEGLVDHDFWLIDDEHAIRMLYYPDGRYMGAEPAPELLDAYRRARHVAVAAAEPFAAWWQRHPEEWRASRAA